MRKYIVYNAIVLIIFFILPLFLVNKKKINTSSDIINTQNNEIQANENDKIKLLHKDTNEVEEMDLEEYIKNVVSAEMPAKYDEEALKAQAVVARTYTVYKIKKSSKHKEADICDKSDCCQAWISKEERMKKWDESQKDEYWNKIEIAVNSTKGQIITYNDEPINAFFHSNSGGKTQIPLYVWGGEGYPYLQVVETSGEENYSQYKSEIELSKEEFEEKIKEKHENFSIDFKEEKCIEITERDESDRVKKIKIGNLELSGVEVRTILKLRSANFTVEILKNNIKFYVIGYGHGVGMSQTGADAMAKLGSNYREIIQHFYTNVEIKEL